MSKPLVSFFIACYNQEWCIREALSAAFAQTYSPLEIIISDDCSSDATWKIVNEMVAEYRQQGGIHSVILNRNDVNSYTAPVDVRDALRDHMVSLIHGELIIQADGDDISMPNRAEEVVRAWGKDHYETDLLISGYKKISKDGKEMGEHSCYNSMLGATLAYTTRLERGFARTPKGAYGDVIRYWRAKMLGGITFIDKHLVNYRVGCGESGALGNSYRNSMLAIRGCHLNSYRQLLLDVEAIKKNAEKYGVLRKEIEKEVKLGEAQLELLSDNFFQRVRACIALGPKVMLGTGMALYGPLLLLSPQMFDGAITRIHYFIQKMRTK